MYFHGRFHVLPRALPCTLAGAREIRTDPYRRISYRRFSVGDSPSGSLGPPQGATRSASARDISAVARGAQRSRRTSFGHVPPARSDSSPVRRASYATPYSVAGVDRPRVASHRSLAPGRATNSSRSLSTRSPSSAIVASVRSKNCQISSQTAWARL